ncbi:osmoprotectant transporter permease [uncultured Sphingomonas sp.]|uniref:osmoprotectant transporter permease n=1 Tax=uncultured Sphingomonas sp. TaxID=158754 RepID=UPI0035CC956C
MWLFRILFAFDAVVLAALGYFFLDGLRYGGSSAALLIWSVVLAVPSAILVAAWMLRARARGRLASLLLLVLAAPPILYMLFFGFLLATTPNWQ